MLLPHLRALSRRLPLRQPAIVTSASFNIKHLRDFPDWRRVLSLFSSRPFDAPSIIRLRPVVLLAPLLLNSPALLFLRSSRLLPFLRGDTRCLLPPSLLFRLCLAYSTLLLLTLLLE